MVSWKSVSYLKVSRWVLFTKGDYWVLKIDANYQIALVCEQNLKYLWILHRDTILNEQVKMNIYTQSLGYELLDLIHTVHTGNKTT